MSLLRLSLGEQYQRGACILWKQRGKTCSIFNLKSLDTRQSQTAHFYFENVSARFFMGVSQVRKPVIKNICFCIPAIPQQAFRIRLLQWTHAACRASGFKGCDVRVCGPDVPHQIYGDTMSCKRGNLKNVIARRECWIYFFNFFLRVRLVKSFFLLQYFFLTLQTQCFFFALQL